MAVRLDESATSARWLGGFAPESRRALRRGTHHTTTVASWSEAVGRVIQLMHERATDEPPTLHEMAEIARFSPYHFNRVFCQVTGLPPGRFLAAVRLEAAKRLLAESRMRVTDICFEVGYQSLGTFSTQFARAVGVPPNRLRRLITSPLRSGLQRSCEPAPRAEHRSGPLITGRAWTPEPARALIFLGLFPCPLPQGRPLACAVLSQPGDYQLLAPADGTYYLFAAALPWPPDRSVRASPESAPIWVAASRGPVRVRGERVSGATDLALRPTQPTDPPIVVSLTALWAEQLAEPLDD